MVGMATSSLIKAPPCTPRPCMNVSEKTLYTMANRRQDDKVREYRLILWKNPPSGVRRTICPTARGRMTTLASLYSVESRETPLPTPSSQMARIGVRKTPRTLAKMALKMAVPMLAPAARVCATQMLIVQGRQAKTKRPSRKAGSG
eukprot:scaffold1503_cov150-Ochromonas_danica.AAC.14